MTQIYIFIFTIPIYNPSMKHSKAYWKRYAKKKGLFGGSIKSKEEIEALNKAIVKREDQEFKAFEKDFDEDLDEVFESEDKKKVDT